MQFFASAAAGMGANRAIGSAALVATGGRAYGAATAIDLSAAAAGQMMVAEMAAATSIVGGDAGDWTYGSLPTPTFGRYAFKVLSQNDIDSGLAFSSATYSSSWAIYSGPLYAAYRSGASSNAGFNIPGFTKNGWCAGLVLVGAGDGTNTVGTPAGWTSRQAPTGFIYYSGLSDLLTPSSYTDGAAIAVPNRGAAGVIELLNY